MTLPIYFAWVTAADTTWSPAFKRMDEDIVSMKRVLREGDFPKLELTIRNPRVGLLADGERWAWLAYNHNGTAVPWFFGTLQGLPNDLDKETISIVLLARSDRYLVLKQAAAEALKGADGYDPVFMDIGKRDDPDVILEGFGAMFRFDPTPTDGDLQVDVSDMVEPEDGYAQFHSANGNPLYDGVVFNIGQQPLVLAGCRATVRWDQRSAGTVDIGSFQFGNGASTATIKQGGMTNKDGTIVNPSRPQGAQNVLALGDAAGAPLWTGGSLIDAWPKPGTKLSGGYSVAAAFAVGNGAQFGTAQSHNLNWENKERQHAEGDTMSISETWTTYPCGGQLFIYDLVNQVGIVDPWASLSVSSADDEPTGVNIPAHVSYSETLVCSWQVNANLALDYDATRPHTEVLEFRLTADVQAVLGDPNLPASTDTEIDEVPGADVGMPIWNVLSWYTLSLRSGGDPVALGQVVKSTAEFPGNPIYARAVAVSGAGHVGADEPSWPDMLGSTVVDGDVTWAILGFNVPSDLSPWSDVANSEIALGTVIRSQFFLGAPVDWVGVPIAAPAAGTQSLQMCVQAGTTQQYTNSTFSGIADRQPQYPQPSFSATPGQTTADGTVVWVSLGDGAPVCDFPLGLNPGQDSYFSTDRGKKSIAYLVSRQRAKIRARARQATVRFEAPFEEVMGLTLRMGAHLYDDRLPGGNALGKITETEIEWNAERGVFVGRVVFRPCLGLGGGPPSQDVSGDYGDWDYDDGAYQITIGLSEAPPSGDIFYSTPERQPDSDGVTFPIVDKSSIIVKEALIVGRPPGAAQYVANSYINVLTTYTMPNGTGGFNNASNRYVRVPVGYTPVMIPRNYVQNSPAGIAAQTQDVYFFPVSQFYLELKPLDGVSFFKQYNIETSRLPLPLGVDLSAGSLP